MRIKSDKRNSPHTSAQSFLINPILITFDNLLLAMCSQTRQNNNISKWLYNMLHIVYYR